MTLRFDAENFNPYVSTILSLSNIKTLIVREVILEDTFGYAPNQQLNHMIIKTTDGEKFFGRVLNPLFFRDLLLDNSIFISCSLMELRQKYPFDQFIEINTYPRRLTEHRIVNICDCDIRIEYQTIYFYYKEDKTPFYRGLNLEIIYEKLCDLQKILRKERACGTNSNSMMDLSIIKSEASNPSSEGICVLL